MLRRSKFGNRKVEYDGYKFDSLAEHDHYIDLRLLESGGLIRDLKVHPVFVLFPRKRINGKVYSKRTYTADFRYYDIEREQVIIEDVKGFDKRTGKAITDSTESRFRREILLRHDGIVVEIVLR